MRLGCALTILQLIRPGFRLLREITEDEGFVLTECPDALPLERGVATSDLRRHSSNG